MESKYLDEFKNIDFFQTEEFQTIIDLAVEISGKKIALLILQDERYKLSTGAGYDQIDFPAIRNTFNQSKIKATDIFIIPDVQKEVFASQAIIAGAMEIRFYASLAIVSKEGYVLGELCLFDSSVGDLSGNQKKALNMLSKQVIYLMDMKKSQKLLREELAITERQRTALKQIAFIQSHEIRHPLTTIMSLVNLAEKGLFKLNQKWIAMLSDAANTLDERIRAIVNETYTEKDIKLVRFNRMVQEIEDYAILLLDEDGKIENWNLGAELVKGYKQGEIIGRNFSVFYRPEDIANGKPQSLIDKAKEFGKAKDEGWRVRKNGTHFWANVLITAIHDVDGKVIGFTKVTKDLGEIGNR
ncbi:PAS domain-containing protein [Pedobacter sp. R20-19]|uniref:PAS domain-containing protein n=1 Tax=Pedobacter sp. R20-19 TaxID=1270196 RepID=UPI0004933140|nr:PAS domain-containing protein [Pedobacter sp. R20-19]